MKAYEIENNRLLLCERPIPQPAPGEVLIEVQACGINRPDLLQRQGLYPPPPGVTDIPGLEVSGIIAESKHPRWKIGDSICALLPGGGYAEFALADGRLCLPVPPGMEVEEAAGIPECFFTIWHNLFFQGRLRNGESILIHGGSSGIGTSAIQLVTAMGGIVYVTAGNEEKCKRCLDLGAAAAINYKQLDYVAKIKSLTDNHGVNWVLDMVGGDYIARNLQCLAPEGRHVSIAFLNGAKAMLPIPEVMKKRLILTGSTLRGRSADLKAKLSQQLEAEIWPMFKNGLLRPVIDSTYPFEDAAGAHARMEKGTHIGKIILSHMASQRNNP